MRQVVLDTETTGLSPVAGHRITEIGCIELINRKVTGNNFHTYLNPEREVDEGAARITGLTLNFLQDKPKFAEIVADFLKYIKDAEVIIHNAAFDVGFINNELRLANHGSDEFTSMVSIVDTLLMARDLHPGQRNSLDALCKRYKVNNQHRNYHGALLDAKILAEVYLAMTAGQTNLVFTNEENSKVNNQTDNKDQEVSKKNVKLTVITASAEELAEHQNYLAEMKAKNSGLCLWE